MSLPILSLILAWLAASPCQDSKTFTESHARAAEQSLSVSERERAYGQAVNACPGEPSLYGEFAAFLIANREFSTAITWLEKGLRIAPGDPTLILQMGAALLSMGQAEKSLAELQKISATDKSRFYMGMAYRHLGNHLAAQKALMDAWRLGYHDPYLLYSLIEEDRSVGDKATGMQHFQLFTQTFPDSAWMHLLLGDAYFDQKAEDDARREYQEAVRIKPDLMDAHYRLGYMDFQRGRNIQAEKEFQTEVELNPDFADAHLFLGETLLRLGQQKEALTHFRRTLELDPSSEMAYHRFAAVLTGMNQLDEAAETLRQGEKHFPRDSTFPAELARVLTKLNRLDEAHREAERARVLATERLKKLDVTGDQ